jgi:hypothetical protein
MELANIAGNCQALFDNNGTLVQNGVGPFTQFVFAKCAAATDNLNNASSQIAVLNGTLSGAIGPLAWPPASPPVNWHIGTQSGASFPTTGYFARVAVWPSNRISNAGLQGLTQ